MEAWLASYQAGARQPDQELIETLQLALPSDWHALLQWLTQLPPQGHEQQQFAYRTLTLFLDQARQPGREAELRELVPAVGETYRMLRGQMECSYVLLQWLAQIGGPQGLGEFTELLVAAPPETSAEVAAACSPLLQAARRGDLSQIFPRALDGIANLSAAAIILDLANYAMRMRIVDQHPAWSRREQLAEMLGRLSRQLERMIEQPSDTATAAKQRHLVAECVSLAVTLCDALALFGEKQFIGKLNQAFELPHRRIRTEAAYALARLGDKTGEKALLELASDPSSRLRVIAYADELEIADQIPEEYQTDVARAESALALWLAEPAQMGMPPSQLELIDRRELFWPGYHEPVDTFLFRFTYVFPTGEFSNIGITGPLTRATSANLIDLSTDDIYALFAGWSAEHDDIFECEIHRLSEPSQRDARRLEQRLRSEGYRDIEPLWMGFFFDQRALLARARMNDDSGVVVVDDEQTQWWPAIDEQQPLGPDEAFSIYKGRKLLAAFNE